MDSMDAKTELLSNHFTHSLQQLVNHYAEAGDYEGLQDVMHLVAAAVDDAMLRGRQQRRLEQHVEVDDETGRRVIR